MKSPEFFKAISERCNYLDVEMVENVYREIVRVTIQDLRKKGMVRFPDFGDFTLIFHKERWMIDVNTKKRIKIPQKRTIKYEPDLKLKKYLQNL
jgi:nucleoid DNA-binding protein